MNDKVFIPIILGTAREGRRSEAVANYIYSKTKDISGADFQIIDVREYLFAKTVTEENEDSRVLKWHEVANKADGFLIVTPEYNRGYPGELKILLDSGYDEYYLKPVALCGVSNGNFAGYRSIGSLQGTLVELGMYILRDSIYFSKVNGLIDEKGVIKDGTNDKRILDVLNELVVFAGNLKKIRNK